MGSVWGLALPLLFFCWEAGVFGDSAGTSSPVFMVLINTTEVPALPQEVRMKSEGAFRSIDLAEHATLSQVSLDTEPLSTKTISKTLIPTSAISEVDSRETSNTSPATETMETQTSYTTAATLEPQLTSFAEEPGKPQKTFPSEETGKPQTTYTAAVTLESQTTSPVEDTGKTQSAFLAEETKETQTTSSATETGKIQTTFPAVKTRLPQTESPPAETRVLTKIITSNFMVELTTPKKTSATSGSLPRMGISTVETGVGTGPKETIFTTLCTDDSSEETSKITNDILTSAHTSTEAERLSSESSSSSESSVQVLLSPQTLRPDTETPSEDLFAYGVTHIVMDNCNITETVAIISGTSDTDRNSAGVMVLSTSDTSALSHSTEAIHISQTTNSASALSTDNSLESVALNPTLETTLLISSTIVSKTTADKTPTPSGTLVTVNRSPLEETSALSIETQSHTEVLGTVSMDAGPTVGKVTSFAGSLASVNSPSAVTTTKNSTPSESIAADSINNRSFSISGSPLPFVHLATTSLKKTTSITLAQTTASPKTLMKSPTSIPTTAWTRKTTKATPGGGGGFLLVQLTMASPEDLTESRVAERLMEQLRCELHNCMPLTQVSLLRIRRG